MQESLVEKNKKLIKNYIKSLNVPPWFRGLSVFQKKAAESLQSSMRDDLGQKTTHRTFNCLLTMGLQPLPTQTQIKKLLRASRGNVIAMLWFLKEWLYNGPESNPTASYSLNEQIIFSCIAQLDMSNTLKELDRILPRNPKKERKMWKTSKKFMTKSQGDIVQNNQKFAPYFETVKPLKQRKTQYTIPPPAYKAHLESCGSKMPTEDPPWFQTYPVKEKCEEEISQLQNNFATFMIEDSKIQQLSQQHEETEILKQSFNSEMDIIFNRLAEEIEEKGKENYLRYSHTMQRLRRDIKKHRQEFQTMLENHRKHYTLEILANGLNSTKDLHSLLKPVKSESDGNFTTLICCGQHSDNNDGPWQASNQSCGCVIGQLVKHDMKSLTSSHYLLPKMDVLMSCQDNQDNKDNVSETDSHKPTESCGCLIGQGDSCEQHCSCCQKMKLKGSSSSLEDFKEKYLTQTCLRKSTQYLKFPSQSFSSFITQNSITSLPPPPSYFETSSNNNVYRFDYRKIFEFKHNNSQTTQLQRAFIEAIDSDIGLLNGLQKQQYLYENSQEKLNEAINKCYQKCFKKGLEEQENRDKFNKSKESTYYDPNNDELMDRMLKDALESMKKDPKFVLASLPEVHNLPYLREWIRLRYGKRYSRKYLTQLSDEDQTIFRAIIDSDISVPVPPTSDLGISSLVDYSCRDYLLKKSDFIRKQYYRDINKAMMEQSRIVYFAMRPLLCGNSSPNNTIFAYMPAHVRQICNFLPWRSHEFQDNRQIAMERLRQVKAQRGNLYL
ncbi:uncharacterized protein [Musca autumnalis]|uniref:uncharacterized protein n=1 Tax=Musca autumnalis TaxID=221902 RepID=UPI003CF93FB9